MSFQEHEKARLSEYANRHWGVDGHVLPYELASLTLQEGVRKSALDYFDRHRISWWIGGRDKRSKSQPPLPTGHLNSSQVACINHLEPARTDREAAQRVLVNVDPSFTVEPVEDGYVDYEWIGEDSYLGEPSRRTRGANVTSLDAVMCAARDGTRILLAIEWKYLERYGRNSVARSSRGTDRIATYRPLLEHPDCPIVVEDIEWLFYEPYDQLMRQTLLAWQMVEHGEFGTVDWIHLHVVPEANVALRENTAAPNLQGSTMAEKWRSVLKQPNRYRLVTPTELMAGIGNIGGWKSWRHWLHDRYLT